MLLIGHWRIPSPDLPGIFQEDHLGPKLPNFLGDIIRAVTSHVSTADVLRRHFLDIDADVITKLQAQSQGLPVSLCGGGRTYVLMHPTETRLPYILILGSFFLMLSSIQKINIHKWPKLDNWPVRGDLLTEGDADGLQ